MCSLEDTMCQNGDIFLLCVSIFLIKEGKGRKMIQTRLPRGEKKTGRESEDGNLSWAHSHQTRWQKLVS